jgi:hypothetical protein
LDKASVDGLIDLKPDLIPCLPAVELVPTLHLLPLILRLGHILSDWGLAQHRALTDPEFDAGQPAGPSSRASPAPAAADSAASSSTGGLSPLLHYIEAEVPGKSVHALSLVSEKSEKMSE